MNTTYRLIASLSIAIILFAVLTFTIGALPALSQATSGEVVVPDTYPPVAAGDIPVVEDSAVSESSANCGYATRNDGPDLDTLRVGEMVGSEVTWAPYGSCGMTFTITLTGSAVVLYDLTATFHVPTHCVRNAEKTWYRCVVADNINTIQDIWIVWYAQTTGYMEIEQKLWQTAGDNATKVFTGTVKSAPKYRALLPYISANMAATD